MVSDVFPLPINSKLLGLSYIHEASSLVKNMVSFLCPCQSSRNWAMYIAFLYFLESIPCEVTIKDEPEDINEFEEPFINFDNFDDKNILEKTYVLVKMPDS